MSEIEKSCLLSLAIDRVCKHGDHYLDVKMKTIKMTKAIQSLQEAVSEIDDWKEFIEIESSWWVDLSEDKTNDD